MSSTSEQKITSVALTAIKPQYQTSTHKIEIDTKICKKWHEALTVGTHDLREDNIL